MPLPNKRNILDERDASLEDRMKQILKDKSTEPKKEPKKILIVDDMPDVSETLKQNIGISYNIETVCFGQDAIDKFNQGNFYDLIFMDKVMEPMSGPETVEEITKYCCLNDRRRPIIVYYSAHEDKHTQEIVDQNPFQRGERHFSKFEIITDVKNIVDNLIQERSENEEKEQKHKEALEKERVYVLSMAGSMLAHEIKNLITRISGYTQVAEIKSKKIDQLEEEYRNNLNKLNLQEKDKIRDAYYEFMTGIRSQLRERKLSHFIDSKYARNIANVLDDFPETVKKNYDVISEVNQFAFDNLVCHLYELFRARKNVEIAISMLQIKADNYSKYTKFEEPTIKDVYLDEMVEYSILEFDEHIEGLQITVDRNFPENYTFKADPDLFYLAFSNLIKNAYQAIRDGNKKNGIITISAENTDYESKISVKDTGIGIPQEIIPKIWDYKFTSKGDGTGFGCFLIKDVICRAHRGNINVFSNGTGTEFIIELYAKNGTEKKN